MPYVVASITLATIVCILTRPRDVSEAAWASMGAALLVALGGVSPHSALHAAAGGIDVYCFLLGMMGLSEIARCEGLFDWLAARVTSACGGSSERLFLFIYLLGVIVTVFLSNDATAVVLTPAVATACARAQVQDARPYLFACAFVANAASFVLPISNPANLVLYGDTLPGLTQWFVQFALPSSGAIVATFLVLRSTARHAVRVRLKADVEVLPLRPGGWVAAYGIVATAIVLGIVSLYGGPLGLSALLCAVSVAMAICLARRCSPMPFVRAISWSVIPLVAALFVVVQALDEIGVVDFIATRMTAATTTWAKVAVATLIAGATNVFNNLPVGVLAAQGLAACAASPDLRAMTVVAVDLGPNLSVTGSLATLLWLVVLRREGIRVSAWRFFVLGCFVMPAALLAAFALMIVPSLQIFR